MVRSLADRTFQLRQRRALARIEREEAERRAKRDERLQAMAAPPPLEFVNAGDSDTHQARLNAYAQKWRADLVRYGPEGLREEVRQRNGDVRMPTDEDVMDAMIPKEPPVQHTAAPDHSVAAQNEAELARARDLDRSRRAMFPSRYVRLEEFVAAGHVCVLACI